MYVHEYIYNLLQDIVISTTTTTHCIVTPLLHKKVPFFLVSLSICVFFDIFKTCIWYYVTHFQVTLCVGLFFNFIGRNRLLHTTNSEEILKWPNIIYIYICDLSFMRF